MIDSPWAHHHSSCENCRQYDTVDQNQCADCRINYWRNFLWGSNSQRMIVTANDRHSEWSSAYCTIYISRHFASFENACIRRQFSTIEKHQCASCRAGFIFIWDSILLCVAALLLWCHALIGLATIPPTHLLELSKYSYNKNTFTNKRSRDFSPKQGTWFHWITSFPNLDQCPACVIRFRTTATLQRRPTHTYFNEKRIDAARSVNRPSKLCLPGERVNLHHPANWARHSTQFLTSGWTFSFPKRWLGV